MPLLGFAFFLATFALRFKAFFAALSTLGGPLHQFAANQLDHGLLRAIPFAEPKPHNARVAALALPETGPQGIEQLLHGFGGLEE